MNTLKKIAKAYSKSFDQSYMIPDHQRKIIHKLIAFQFADKSKQVWFEFLPQEVYEYDKVAELMPDFERGKVIVNSTGNNSTFWGEAHNLMFRAIHDYIHVVNELDFNFEHEKEAYEWQLIDSLTMADKYEVRGIDWKLYSSIIRSEIVYQAAVKTHYGTFHLTNQKIILKKL